MRVLCHHLYEYKKGVRRMILHTMPLYMKERVIKKMEDNSIYYSISDVTDSKFNIFFGDRDCVEVVKSFGTKPLNEYTDTEDFIVGVLLGYDVVQQSQRYLRRKRIWKIAQNKIA
ncbi:DUF2023 family protein [Chitinivibrio alkaliphilus]|uniref:DUF2023 domain-containing protein n=1 Tax=Chitinivibrio alkaliphilus ACht1 TaxID=1313304 RepID=U7D6M4_9BACT|nr:DUF2023 family protein [Chitinivibrio alkaliphilus]ERP31221.1 hypothetical protein CALK_1835 [Chitinivibrio alkaliphilus ACht1]